MASKGQSALQPQDMLQNRSCGRLNSSALKFYKLHGQYTHSLLTGISHTQSMSCVVNVLQTEKDVK